MNKQSKTGIVAFGFGEPSDLQSNKNIADCVTTIVRAEPVSIIYTDRDVAPHVQDNKVTVKEIDPARKPTTYRLALMAIKESKANGLQELHVVAAACHMWRCQRDLQWVAFDLKVSIKFSIHPITENQFNSAAITQHTRAPWIWWPLEIPYRIVSSLLPSVYKRLRA